MKLIIQRVKHASVSIDGEVRGEIGQGLMILFGAKEGDAFELIPKLAAKAANLRIFEDEAGKMNRSALEVGGGALVVPNFTLLADTKKGNRPSFVAAAKPPFAREAFERFCEALRAYPFTAFGCGVFGADMLVELANDGPVTIVMDTDEWAAARPDARREHPENPSATDTL